MTDQPPAPASPPAAPSPVRASAVDWPTTLGVVGIVLIALGSMGLSPANAHDIAISAVSVLGGWIGHKAVERASS